MCEKSVNIFNLKKWFDQNHDTTCFLSVNMQLQLTNVDLNDKQIYSFLSNVCILLVLGNCKQKACKYSMWAGLFNPIC